MISAEQALRKVLKNAPLLPAEKVPLDKAAGRVLSETVKTDRPAPPYDRVMMDGIAIGSAAFQKGQRCFVIEDVQGAGTAPLTLKDPRQAVEVMTGAVLPRGTDCVIPYEDFLVKKRSAAIKNGITLRRWQHIHRKGSDASKGRIALKKGAILQAPEIAAAASVGASCLEVHGRPKIVMLATGNELVSPGCPVKDYQIYLSNPYALRAAVSLYGFGDMDVAHCRDDKKEMARLIKKALRACDVLIMSGGISKGKYDYARELLLKQRVKEIFYRVKQRPGKPLWFGRAPGKQLVFALPGNPISALTCFYQYVLPALSAMGGRGYNGVGGVCSEDITSPSTALTHSIPVRIQVGSGRYQAEPVLFANSGDVPALALTDGFIQIPENQRLIKKGECVKIIPWSPLWFAGR